MTLLFSGTPGLVWGGAPNHTSLAGQVGYSANGQGVHPRTAGVFIRVRFDTVVSSPTRSRVKVRRTATGSGSEAGLGYVNTAGSGFSGFEVGTSFVLRNEVGGDPGGTIATVTVPGTVGTPEYEMDYNNITNEVKVYLNGSLIMTEQYEGGAEDLYPVFQVWRPDSEVLSVEEFEVSPLAQITLLVDTVEPGGRYAMETEGLDDWDTATLGTKELTIDGTDIVVPAWTNGYVEALNPGSDYTLTVTDINGVFATLTLTYGIPTGYTHNQMGAGMSVDTGPQSIGSDPAIIAGTDVYPPPLGGGTMNNAGNFTSVPFSVYEDFWLRDLDSQMWKFAAEVTNSEVIVDYTPDAFSFTDQSGVATTSTITSAPITVTGISAPSPISVSGGSYSINGGAFVTSAGTVAVGDTVRVRHTSSGSFSTAVSTTLTIGGVSDTFTSTTLAASTTPNQFVFDDVANATASTQSTSNTITISGITESVAVSIVGGTYSKNGGAYTASAGTAVNGDTFSVRTTSGPSPRDSVNVTLTVGGTSDTYTVNGPLAATGSGYNKFLSGKLLRGTLL